MSFLQKILKLSLRLPVLEKRKFKINQSPKLSLIFAVLLALLLCFVTIFMFPRGRTYSFSELQIGDVYIGEEIIAPFDFPINKSEEQLKHDVEEAKKRVPYVFMRNSDISHTQNLWLENFFKTIALIRDSSIVESKKIETMTSLLMSYNIIFSDDNITSLLHRKTNGLHQKDQKESDTQSPFFGFEDELLQLNKELYSIGILNLSKYEIQSGNGKISVINNGEESIEDTTYYLSPDDVKYFVKDKIAGIVKNKNNEAIAKVGYQIIVSSLVPNIIYDKTETENRIQQAIHSVPLAKGMILQNERIIDTHERVTNEQLQKLQSLLEAKAELAESEGGVQFLLPFVGKFLVVALALSLFILFLYFRRSELLLKPRMIFLLYLVFQCVIFLSYILNRFGLSEYLLPITIASVLLTIFFDLEIGFIATISLGVIAGALRGNDFNAVIVSIFAGAIAVISVNRVRTRNWLLRSLVLIIGAYILSITALEFLRYPSLRKLLVSIGFGAMNGLISTILAYGFSVIIEAVFDLTTDMKLLELSDLNKPLLRELAMKAPGTYFHSAVVGNLSETAAEAIGANSLLTRVGAYYHDIGKIINPKYFIENQNRGSLNPHEKLAPTMSSLILVNHVRKGIELAKKHKLPSVITDFITQHHGTNLMNPFYQKAIKQNKNKENSVNESNFRYPGPRPKSKETGIVMLADSIEAASRTLKDPTVSRIQAMVNSIIRERFSQSELDECPLTLSDLHKIAESFQKFLIGIFHARVEYPDQEEKFFRKGKIVEK
jgi:putative nucleotidyltransferase with HDIG domain